MTASAGAARGALRWSVRESFRQYVSNVPGASETIGGDARLDGDSRVIFPGIPDNPDLDGGVGAFAFSGSIHWLGHGGAMDVEIRDPRIELVTKGRSMISVAPASRGGSERIEIAAFVDWSVVDGRLLVPAPRLTWAGVTLLGNVYEIGDPLDPLEIIPG